MTPAEGDAGQAVLEPRGQHDAAHDGGEEEEDGVHQPGGDAAVAAAGTTLADGAGGRAKAASSRAAQGYDGSHPAPREI